MWRRRHDSRALCCGGHTWSSRRTTHVRRRSQARPVHTASVPANPHDTSLLRQPHPRTHTRGLQTVVVGCAHASSHTITCATRHVCRAVAGRKDGASGRALRRGLTSSRALSALRALGPSALQGRLRLLRSFASGYCDGRRLQSASVALHASLAAVHGCICRPRYRMARACIRRQGTGCAQSSLY